MSAPAAAQGLAVGARRPSPESAGVSCQRGVVRWTQAGAVIALPQQRGILRAGKRLLTSRSMGPHSHPAILNTPSAMRFVCLPLSSPALATPPGARRQALPHRAAAPASWADPAVRAASPSAPGAADAVAEAWSDTMPACFRSEAFAEDLDELATG
jgi:hypothetical protein